MRVNFHHHFLLVTLVACVFFVGCMFRPAKISTRSFVLAPLSTNELSPTAMSHLSVEIEPVKMPSYLRRDSMMLRHDTDEITYLEDALWAERLDQSFQRTVAANLSHLLHSDRVYLTDWPHDIASIRVFVSVQQFDVDTAGRGTLTVQWRITAARGDSRSKSGQVHLTRRGLVPHSHPDVIVGTLSDLTAEFSRSLSESIVELANSNPLGTNQK